MHPLRWCYNVRGCLHERKRSTFSSPTCSKNKPALKIFFVLYEKNYFWLINYLKGDWSIPECYALWDFQSVYDSFMAHLGEPLWSSKVNQPIHLVQAVQIITEVCIYIEVYYFAESVEGMVWCLVQSGSKSVSLIYLVCLSVFNHFVGLAFKGLIKALSNRS